MTISSAGVSIESPRNGNNKWHLCCFGDLDINCITYFSQLFILLIVISVSLYKLVNDGESALFVSLLSSSLGILCPSPNLKKK
jgi:hypothetical protein